MSDDPLDRALAAYSETRGAARRAGPDVAATRARMLRSAAAADRRRSMRRWSALAVLILASNATTWAWTAGHVERVMAVVEARVGGESVRPTAAGRAVGPEGAAGAVLAEDLVGAVEVGAGDTVGAVAPVAAEAPVAAVAAEAPVAAEARDARPGGRVAGSSRARGSASARTGAGPVVGAAPVDAGAADAGAASVGAASVGTDAAEAALDNADRVAFEAAHHAHFRGGDASAALRAWDDYLARFPRGRFLPEAVFNRAICLIRLGRAADARPALERVASGMYGTAHQDDAAALLERLGAAE